MTPTPRFPIATSLDASTLPRHMNDATTRSSVLRFTDINWPWSGWMYYREPVLCYLRGLGCREDDTEDLCHEILIRLQTDIALKYDPARPFRPYFKAAIRHFYLNHLRDRHPTMPLPDADEGGPVATISDPAGNDGLLDFACQLYDLFSAEADERTATGILLLRAWLIDGVRQEELARGRGITDRQVRKHLATAADAFAIWMEGRTNPEDLDELASLAKAQGTDFDLGPRGIRGLFTHLSQRKRMRTLLILAMIHRQARRREA